LSGSEFQTVGAATEKARLAETVRVRGTASLGAWLDRSDREVTCGTSIDRRYAGADVALALKHTVAICARHSCVSETEHKFPPPRWTYFNANRE